MFSFRLHIVMYATEEPHFVGVGAGTLPLTQSQSSSVIGRQFNTCIFLPPP
jgi:hypothetical protein